MASVCWNPILKDVNFRNFLQTSLKKTAYSQCSRWVRGVRSINTKFIMIWWEQWELTHWNSFLTPCIEKLSGTLHVTTMVRISLFTIITTPGSYLLTFQTSQSRDCVVPSSSFSNSSDRIGLIPSGFLIQKEKYNRYTVDYKQVLSYILSVWISCKCPLFEFFFSHVAS